MGYVLLNYDFKWSGRDFQEGGYFPPTENFGIFARPNDNETIVFRRRKGI